MILGIILVLKSWPSTRMFPRRSSDPDPNLAFIINKTRAYYESYSNDWTGSFTGYPMVREGIFLDEIEAECGTRFIIADISAYYLNNNKTKV